MSLPKYPEYTHSVTWEPNDMTPSVRDNLLMSYEVRCDERTISLRTERRSKIEPSEFVDVIFKGVEGYHFENDAFGNIIFDVETVAIDQLLKEHRAEISESYRMAGAPGPWASNLETASALLLGKGVRGFVLASSLGLSGWVLAREISIVAAHQSLPINNLDAGTF
jgi:hypothetical protein